MSTKQVEKVRLRLKDDSKIIKELDQIKKRLGDDISFGMIDGPCVICFDCGGLTKFVEDGFLKCTKCNKTIVGADCLL